MAFSLEAKVKLHVIASFEWVSNDLQLKHNELNSKVVVTTKP